MCGRYNLQASTNDLMEVFSLLRSMDVSPRPNIYPTQPVPAVILDPESEARVCEEFRWGLIPSWSKTPGSGPPLINARSETIATKPAFRAPLKPKRCLIPASGFFEWKAIPGQKKKQPIWIGVRNQPVLAFAGLWDSWKGSEDQEIRSCTIITTTGNSAMAGVHDRMPVILPSELFHEWLDPDQPVDHLLSLLRPSPSEEMVLSAEIADELLSEKPPSSQRTLF
ncbi:SOS response-associated peptidase [Planctomicrobium sp. SH661]|uniref:SOS response-associated peptidase n=1 Tax=Planctomicrobium sp. SH661 TaxID=3448124 RepID=UPI003F5BB4E8